MSSQQTSTSEEFFPSLEHLDLAMVEASGALSPRSHIVLIQAYRHGAVVIPHEIAREVPKAAELCPRREEPILATDFSLEALDDTEGHVSTATGVML